MKSNSYCASEARSCRRGNGITYNDSTITGGVFNNQAAGIWQNHAVPSYDSTLIVSDNFGPPLMKAATPYYNPYHYPCLEEPQWLEFSSNGYSSIGSQFELDTSPDFKGNPLMDPVSCQGLWTDAPHTTGSTAASQISCENFLPLNPKLSADGIVPPTISTASAYADSPYCNLSLPFLQPGQDAMPTKATTWLAPTSNGFSTDPSVPSTFSANAAFLGTRHLNRSSKIDRPNHEVASRAAGTHNSPHGRMASLGCTGNVPSSNPIAETEAPPNPVSTQHRFTQDTSPDLASIKPSKPSQPQAIDHSGYDKSLEAIVSAISSPSPPSSITKSELEYGVLYCSWKGCSATRKGKHRKSNMQSHVRDSHKKHAPPMCELCGHRVVKQDSLRRHIEQKHDELMLSPRAGTVRKRRTDGTIYTSTTRCMTMSTRGK